MAGRKERRTGWGGPIAVAPALDDVRAAAERLRPHIVRTPVMRLASAEGIWLKPEVLQPTGSFKVRGVLNWALSLDPRERRRGFLTFSAGNTALALGHAARMFGVSCRSLLPDYAPPTKVKALERAGVKAELLPADELFDWVFRAGWQDEPEAFLHPWTEPQMLAGHATLGLELFEQLPDVETVFLPVGGGALCAGAGSALKALKPGVRVVAVQAANYPALAQSLGAGRPVWVDSEPTACDGVAVPFVTDAMFPLMREVADEVVLVSEERVKAAIGFLAREAKLVAEGAGALGVAAASDELPQLRGVTACPVTGGNIEPGLLAAVLVA
ncbi:pyridoxal-phosphate dependent enzyme [candidate division WOR-3 bacterium]|nr:pyridoxal-phosphate dependent enzyme [candidate division WOR-3 bacterium]